MLAAVMTAAVLLAGTALAYTLSGGEFFFGFFTQKAEKGAADYSYMDVTQLSEIAGTTLGTVVDTEELRIEVMDVIASGSDAMAALRVTAKQLDSVLLYTGWDEVPLNNYRFGSELAPLNLEPVRVQYIYSDEDASLADNQFYLVLAVACPDGLTEGHYFIELGSFGYYDRFASLAAGESGCGVTAVYEGPWAIDLALSGDTGHSRSVLLNRSADIGGYTYTIEGIYLTPFSCTTVISYKGAPDLSSERNRELAGASSDFALYLTDGTSVAYEERSVANDGNEYPDSTYRVTVRFDVPVNVSDIDGFHIFGQDYDISCLIDHEGGSGSAANGSGTGEPVIPGSNSDWTAPETPSFTTVWTDADKYMLYDKILNSIDYFDYASGGLSIGVGGEKYEVSFRVNLPTGESYEEVTDENGDTIQIEYSDGQTRYLVYPQRSEYETAACERRGDGIPAGRRISTDEHGINAYFYRMDGTNTVYTSKFSLLPQGLAMKYLSNEDHWYFIGTADICGRDCVAIRCYTHEAAAEGEPEVAAFEMLIDSETGVVLQYLAWDAERNITVSCVVSSLSYQDPGSFSDAEENVKELIKQYALIQ
jgi:hypothetical protein